MIGLNDLPLEVIDNIYKYLSVNEINRARLTCNHLFNASKISSEYLKKSILIFPNLIDNSILETFSNCETKFQNVSLFSNVKDISVSELNQLNKFFSISNIHLYLKSLKIENCSWPKGVHIFLKMLQNLNNLVELKDFSYYVEAFCPNTEKVDLKLKSLGVELHTLKIFGNLKNLIKLEVRQKMAYIDTNLIKMIKNNGQTLKSLSIHLEFFDGLKLNNLFQETNLMLNEFHLTIEESYEFSSFEFINFLRKQTDLQVLTLHGWCLVNNEVIEILEKLPKLKKLDISPLEKLELENSLIHTPKIFKLKNLKSLSCDEDVYYDDEEGVPDFNLEVLKCTSFYMTDYAFSLMSKNFNNLRVLHLSYSSKLNDNGIQSLIKNGENLIDLIIGTCSEMITDYRYTGIDLKTQEKSGYSISCLEKLISLKLYHHGITKETLINGIKFKNLKKLNLFLHCENSSDLNEFEIMTKSCPSIEYLKLNLFDFHEGAFHELLKIIIKNLLILEKVVIKSPDNFELSFLPKTNYFNFEQKCLCSTCNKTIGLCNDVVKKISR